MMNKRFHAYMILAMLLAGTGTASAGDYDIGWFQNDWKIWAETDPDNIDNAKLYIKFLYSHSSNDDGWREDEGGVKIKLKSVFQTQPVDICKFTCDDYGGNRTFTWETDNISSAFSSWSIDDESVSYSVNQPPMSNCHDNECKASHYHYATMTLTPPARALNNNVSVQLYGTWWRWGAGWADKYYNSSLSTMLSYDVTPGRYDVIDVDVDENGKPYAKTQRFIGNASKYSTYVLKCDADEIDFYNPEAPNGNSQVAYTDHNVYFNGSLAYTSTPKRLSTYSEAFYGEMIAVNKRVVSENVIDYYGFPVPDKLSASFDIEHNKTVLKWNCQAIPSYATGGHWLIVKYDKTNQLTTTAFVQFNDDLNPSYQYTDESVRLGNTYTYRVYYQRSSWPSDRKFEALSSQECEIYCSSDINLRSALPEMNGNDISFKISFNPSVSDNFYAMEVYRDGYKQTDITGVKKNVGELSWTDVYNAETNPLSVNVSHEYRFVMYGGSNRRELQSIRLTARSARSTAISDFAATLGVGSTGIDLNWKAARSYTDTAIDTMRILRRDISSDLDFAVLSGASELHSTSINNSYSDKDNCKAGVIYEYRLQQMSQGQWADVGSALGYVIGTGSVSGRVTYPGSEGSNSFIAAQGVEVMLTPFSAGNSSQRAYPLRSCMLSHDNDSIAISLTDTDMELLRKKGYTLSYWKKGSSTSDRWQHFAYVGQVDGESASLILSDADSILSIASAYMKIGKSIVLKGADTYYDEIQLWSGELSASDIFTYSLRHLGGNENGLLAYVPMDEAVNAGYSFDQALNGTQTRGHHASLTTGILIDNDAAPVSFRTTTDAMGNFSLQGLPFDDGGRNIGYRLTPVYGAHSFTPATQSVLLTQDEKTHTQLDFTDNTSITLSGTVSYQYGNFPVCGAVILIDGNPVSQTITTAYGEMTFDVTTDASGKYAVQTTPGQHTVSMSLEGHTYVEPVITVNAQSDVKDIDFTDKTLMRVTGKVAGGALECSLPLPAYQYSKANIGQATLYLRPSSNLGYTLNTTGKPVELGSGDTRINSTTTLQPYSALANSDTTVVITTDPNTGEFSALLPPINFTITAGSTRSVSNDELRAYDMPEISPAYDGNGFVDTCVICYDSEPKVFLIDGSNNNDYGAIGLDTVKIGGKEFPLYKVVEGYGSDSEEYIYTMGHPVIAGGSSQCFTIVAFQRFRNAERDTTYTYYLPEGTEISFVGSNFNDDESAAANTLYLDNEGSATYLFTASQPSSSYTGTIPFQAHFRLNNREYTYPAEAPIEVILIGANVSEGKGFITTGPDQIDFVLHRPPGTGSYATLHSGTTILSSAIVSEYETTKNSSSSSWFAGAQMKMATGYTDYFSFYVKAGAIGDKSSGSSSTISNTSSSYTINSLSRDITTGSGAAFVGSDGDVFIGHSLSKITGRCYNYNFTTSMPSDPMTPVSTLGNENGDVCYLVGYEDNVIGMAALDTTAFAFTKRYIVNELMPEIVKYRNSLILPMDSVPQFESGDSVQVKYVSLLPAGDAHFGEDSTYVIVASPTASELEKNIDAVRDCNIWLANWKQVLASDEQRRIEADYTSAVTVSAGADYNSIYEREVSESQVETTSYTYTDITSNGVTVDGYLSISDLTGKMYWMKVHDKLAKSKLLSDLFQLRSYAQRLTEDFDNALLELDDDDFDILNAPRRRQALTIPSIGVSGNADFSWVSQYIQENSQGTSESKTGTIKLSYVIADTDPYDYLTVAVSDTTDVSSLCYRLDGGATTGPWEGPEVSQYYAPGTVISNGTLKVEKPVVRLESSTLTDIPSGHDATLTLHITNGSETNVAQYYTVELQSASNPDGLSVMMDGLSLAQQKIRVWLEAGQTVSKTITVSQTRQDVMDYEGVQLVVSGLDVNLPEYDNLELRPVVDFAVHFKPSCSDIDLSITDQSGRAIGTLNQVTSDVVRFTVSGYDLQYQGFQKIQLQRYDRDGQQWQTFHEWYLDASEARTYSADSVCGLSSLSYDYDMHSMADDSYRFRAVTCGLYGTEPVSYEAPEQTLVKDVTAPYAMTTYPVSGTLTSDGEVAVTFNEDIYKERIVDANIIVTGSLNNQPFLHNTGLALTATDPVLSSSPVRVSDQGSSIEFWLQRAPGYGGTVLSHGEGDGSLSLGFDDADHLWVRTPSGTYTTAQQFSTQLWYYIHIGITDHKLGVAMLWNDDDGTPHQEWVLQPSDAIHYNQRAVLRLGEGVYGRISHLTLWSTPRTDIALIAGGKDVDYSVGEEGLQHYWPCSECHGTLASDRIHECNLVLPNANYWYNSEDNWSAYFNGSDMLTFPTDSIFTNIKSTTDVTVELWMRADKTTLSHQEILWLGQAGMTLEDGRPYYGHLLISDTDLRDDQWHHIAVSVLRNRAINFYVDGKETGSAAAGQVVFGYAQSFIMGRDYHGLIDEVRLWNACITADAIRDGMYKRPSSSDKGLVWYESMEDTVRLKTLGTYMVTAIAPSLQPSTVEQSVSHTWTASDRKIVIKPTEAASVIEGCTLRFTVDKIADVNGNDILVPITWTAVVKASTLKSSSQDLSFETTAGESVSGQLTVTNQGGADDVISVTNIPSWLSLSEDCFTLQPLESRSLTLTVPAGVPSGIYETALQLTSSATGITDIVGVHLKVNAVKPDWAVSTDLPSICSLLASVSVGSYKSEDECDELVAYVTTSDGSPIYLGRAENSYLSGIGSYRFFLDIHYDASSRDSGTSGLLSSANVPDRKVRYLFWDNSESRIYKDVTLTDYTGSPLELTLDDMEDFRVYGTPLEPCLFHTGAKVDQTLSYGYGWNWVSLNVNAGESLSDYFQSDGSLTRIKTQDWFADFSEGTWHADQISTQAGESLYGRMYMVESTGSQEHTVEGISLTPSDESVGVREGWNWLPYYPSMNMPLGYALNGIHTEGDIIKSQDGFAYYVDGEWIGSLKYLQPGEGYMYYATEAKELVYPDSYVPTYKAAGRGQRDGLDAGASASQNTDASHAYPFNMCCVITPVCGDFAITEGTVYAYDAEGNLRGAATIGNADSEGSDERCFLTISGNENCHVVLVLETADGTVYTSESAIDYVSNSILGTPDQPERIAFRVGDTTDMNDILAPVDTDEAIYDVAGRKVNVRTEGIFISSGKKVLNR